MTSYEAPGDHCPDCGAPTPPRRSEPVPNGRQAAYTCPRCGTTWTTSYYSSGAH